MRIHEVELRSPDPSAQVAFYGERLGLPAEGDTVQVGGTRLRFVTGQAPVCHLAFNIPENQIEAGKTWIAERAKMPSGETFDFDFWNAHAVYFEDHDGNILELIARHSLDNGADATFGPRSLLEVSEVGIASEAPAQLVARLEGEVGLPVYSGDRQSFTAVGDERGLLIVVAAGRNWLPTEIPAAPVPLRLTIEGAAASELDLGPEPVRLRLLPPPAPR